MSILQKTCKVEGCANGGAQKPSGVVYFRKGMCNAHYLRLARHGRLHVIVRRGENRSKDPLYSIYRAMWRRCYNKNAPDYARYGGKNIYISKEWLGIDGFTRFKEYMGEKPFHKATIDRINSRKGYEPGNVRWASYKTQAINRGMMSNNTSGIKGVGRRSNGRWYASIRVDRKLIYLGTFKNKDDAIKARKAAESKYFSI